MKNLGLKVFSLAIAVILYSFVNSEGNSAESDFTIPIELRNLSRNRMVIAPINRRVSITVKGPSALVSRLNASPLAFKVHLPDNLPNRYVVPLRREDLSLPPYFQVTQIEPSEVEYTFDNRVIRTVPVEVPRIGSLHPGLSLNEVTVTPSTVQLDGPETELKGIDHVDSYPLDLRDIGASVTRELGIKLPGTLVNASVETVHVGVGISVQQSERELRDLPIEVRSSPGQSFAVRPRSVNVTVRGPQDQLDQLKRDEVVPYVRIRPDSVTSGRLVVAVDLPDSLTLLAVNPAEVTVVGNKTTVKP